MVGRAGRAGLSSTGDSFLIIEKKDLNQASFKLNQEIVGMMLLSSVDKCVSTLAENEYHGLGTLIFSSIGLGVAVSLPELKTLASRSLLALQALDLNIDVSAKVVDIVEKLRDMELVRIKQEIDEVSPASSLTGKTQ
ncbi:Helicase POLQ-like [Portunus trituberculatus]|uniref:Helicase POLQ-like n=1 Tax=Portunus trituberculatus TaxID=210409 RepID=A0A5B7H4Q2_PORTR|nr:Helicase POLQ-like [Portunus trituberculatus]